MASSRGTCDLTGIGETIPPTKTTAATRAKAQARGRRRRCLATTAHLTRLDLEGLIDGGLFVEWALELLKGFHRPRLVPESLDRAESKEVLFPPDEYLER